MATRTLRVSDEQLNLWRRLINCRSKKDFTDEENHELDLLSECCSDTIEAADDGVVYGFVL